MADIRNFGLVGVGSNVQLGKTGPRLSVNTEGTVAIEARSANGSLFVPIRAAAATLATEVVVKSQLDAAVSNIVARDGFDIQLGGVVAKGDGAWTPGAVPLVDTTTVSEAVDRLNEVLSLLIPAQPPQLTATTLTVTSTGNTPRLASGSVPNNSGTLAPVTAGSAATRITAASVTSNTFSDVGPAGSADGSQGTLTLLLNGSASGSRALTFGAPGTLDNGTFGGLVISDDKAFPVATPGFWESMDVSVSQAVSQGWNRIRLQHTGCSPQLTNEVFFVRDNVSAVPVVSGLTFSQATAGTQAFSSSVPHYGTGGQLTVNLAYTNLSGEFYYGGTDPVTISATNSAFTAQNFDYPALGITTPVARQTTVATTITPVTVNVNGSIFGSGQLQAVARNVNGASTTASATGTILVFNNASQGVNENNIAVTTLGTGTGPAVRVGMGSGNTPALNTVAAWASSESLADHEAAVVAGVLSRNVTDYSTGFFPAGPNLNTAGRANQQYITLRIQRSAVSQFRIAVTGSYAGCWVALPGVTDNATISPNAIGGAWWNMFAAYDGAGVPGEAGDTAAGCASGTVMSGGSGTFTAVFGPQSSSNATSNFIYVRFRLNAGQSITALSFSN